VRQYNAISLVWLTIPSHHNCIQSHHRSGC